MPKRKLAMPAKPEAVSESPATRIEKPALSRTLRWILAIVAATILPYIPSLRGNFTLDDWAIVVKDKLAHSLANCPTAFTHDFLRGFLGPDVSYYRPLVTTTFQANWQMSGPNPFAFRLTNLLFAVICALLVFALARRVTKNTVAAGLAGVAFSLLPSHTEAVAWISGRTDLMSCMFTTGSLLTFAAAQEARPRLRVPLFAATGLLFACGLFSKENAFTLPILAAGYAWVFGGDTRPKQIAKWVIVLLIPFSVYMVLHHYAVHVTVVRHMGFMLAARLLGIGIAYFAYLRMILAPHAAHPVYDIFPIGMKYPLVAIAAWGIPVGLAVFAVWARKRLPALSFSAFWILITVLPVSNVLPTSGPLPTDRFAFLPSVGGSIVLGWLGWRMLNWRPASIRVWPVVSVVIVVWFVAYCAALTVAGTRIYQSNLAWAQAVVDENTRFLHNATGDYYMKAGLLDRAIPEFEAAIRYEPDDLTNYYSLSQCWRIMGKPSRAIEVMLRAKDSNPPRARIEYNLGLGYAEQGSMEEAEAAFERAVEIQPHYWRAWRNLGKARLELKDYQGAISAYEKGFSIIDLGPSARASLSQAYKAIGEPQKARQATGRS